MHTVRSGPVLGLVAQVALLAGLAGTTGLGVAAWLAGLACGVFTCAALIRALRRAGAGGLAPGDWVTLARATLVGGVTALAVDSFVRPPAAGMLLALAIVALVLDAVDGQVARRTGTATPLGARFDMEVDAFLLLALSGYLARQTGAWVLAIGGMRYAFVAAGWALPWMTRPLPPRHWRKVVAATQGTVLVSATADVLPQWLTNAALMVSLVLLIESFGRDVLWLWHRRGIPVTAPAAEVPAAEVPAAEAPAVAGSGGHPGRIGWLRWSGWAPVATVLAGLLVLSALLLPNQISAISPAAFLRIPLEGLVGVVVLIVLPVRVRPVVAVLFGAVLGVVTVVKIIDMGFFSVLARPFNLAFDWSLFESAIGFVAASYGRAGAIGFVAGAVVLAVAVPVLLALSALRLARLLGRHRGRAAPAVGAFGVGWVVCAVLGAQLAPGAPVASQSTAVLAYEHASGLYSGLRDRQAFAAELAVDRFRDVPDGRLLTALRGKDVIVAFVESYGRVAVEDPELGPRVSALLADGDRRLRAAGFASRSGFLTSPTTGGNSWLAHDTLLAGVWVDNQQRHRTLLGTDRMTLNRAFGRAGWRTVGVMSGAIDEWPEGAFFGNHQIYAARDLGYRGRRFSFATMPDQYTMSFFQRTERARKDRAPLMAEIPLISSHGPWNRVPKLIDWNDVGDGSVYRDRAAPVDAPREAGAGSGIRAQYRRSIEYTLSTLISYLETYGDKDLVLVFLGDHQPAPMVTGEGAGRDVPITIVAGDPAVLDRVSSWGWQDGLKPGPDAPVWPMDTFRDRFLTAFGPHDS